MADPFQPKFVDLVRNYTATVGTADFVLGPAANGYSGFTAALQIGDSFYYSALGVDKPAEHEVGRGTLLDKGVISRDPIGGTKTNFSTGTKSIALIAAAEWFNAIQAGADASNWAASRSALASAAVQGAPMLTEAGREGIFAFDGSNLSAQVAADRMQGLYVAPASDPTGASGAWVRKFDGALNARWFGLVEGDDPANGAVNAAAVSAMLQTLASRRASYPASVQNCVERVVIPYGVYWIADAGAGAGIELTSAVILEGHAVGYGNAAPILKFPGGVSGIRVQDATTSGANVKDAALHEGAQGTILRNLALNGSFGGSEAEAHGVVARTTVRCENVLVRAFEGDGFHIAASTSAASGANPPFGNTCVSAFINCSANNNRNGLFFDGSDANACTIINLNANANRQAGIYDSSAIGNSYFGGQLAGNGTTPANDGLAIGAVVVSSGGNCYGAILGQEGGASTNAPSGTTADNAWWYYVGPGAPVPGIPAWSSGMLVRAGGPVLADEVGASNVFDGVYAENSGARAQIWQRSIVKGGQLANWLYNNPAANKGTAVLRGGNNGSIDTETAFQVFSGTVTAKLGALQANPSSIILNAVEPSYSPAGHQLRFANLSGGALLLTYGSSAAASTYGCYLSGPNSTDQYGTGVAQPHTLYAPRLALGGVSPSVVNARRIYIDSAAPVSGEHGAGEFVHARSATAGLIGWVCRTAGTPGTWEAVYSGFGTNPIGYAAGAGGAVVQATSKSAAVALNALSGQITTSSAALAAGATVVFTVTNNQVATTDSIILNLKGGQVSGGPYRYWIDRIQAGSFNIAIENRSGGALSEALTFNFAIVKAVNA